MIYPLPFFVDISLFRSYHTPPSHGIMRTHSVAMRSVVRFSIVQLMILSRRRAKRSRLQRVMQALLLERRLEQTNLRAVGHTTMMQAMMQKQRLTKRQVVHWQRSRNRCCLCTAARKLHLRR